MSRRNIDDTQDIYRVIVRRKKKIRNPEWRRSSIISEPYMILTDDEYDSSYGPYPKLGTARGVQTHEAYKDAYLTEAKKPRSEYQWDVVDSWIEKVVEIKWERI